MAYRLHIADPAFESAFQAFLRIDRHDGRDITNTVAAIIAAIREEGFAALTRLTKTHDGVDINEASLRVTQEEIKKAINACGRDEIAALETAAMRIRAYHEQQTPRDELYTDKEGVRLGWRWTSVDSAGLYTPGGLATYPSSVLMNGIPASVAGVPRLVMATPMPQGEMNPLVLAAAHIAGVHEIYPIGGAQAIAALACGAGPIAPVDVIVGPGNAYVAEAKRQLFGMVGIDSVAGPSEILVVADGKNEPRWISADLLSQAEHDPSSQSILITDDKAFANAVEATITAQLEASSRRAIAEAAWKNNSAIIIVGDIKKDAPALINAIAPEHLELALDEPDALLGDIRHAGAIFLGRHTPEAIGDYMAGPNHVLPTARAARYASGLSVTHFMKRTSLIGCGPEGLAAIGPAAATLANAERLPSHAESIRIRLK